MSYIEYTQSGGTPSVCRTSRCLGHDMFNHTINMIPMLDPFYLIKSPPKCILLFKNSFILKLDLLIFCVKLNYIT